MTGFLKTAAVSGMRRWRTWSQGHRGRRILRAVQYALVGLVVIYLAGELSAIGWKELAGSLPDSMWFYLFFLLRFFVLPLSELAVYEIVWSCSLVRHFLVFVRKRVYNFLVMGYSGEAFFMLWARRRLGFADRKILCGIKDSNLLSAFTSNAATAFFILVLAFTGGLHMGLAAFPGAEWLFLFAFVSAVSLSVLLLVFRRKLLSIPAGVFSGILTVHAGRLLLMILLHTAMYTAAIPEIPPYGWGLFVVMQLVISRVPFIPGQDLVYLGAGLALASLIGAPEAAVAGMLAVEAGLSQLLNAFMFVMTVHLARTTGYGQPEKANGTR